MTAPAAVFRFRRPAGTFTVPTPCTDMVELFRTEAAQAGDLDAVAVCDRALTGSRRALRVVAGWLCDAEAAAMPRMAK